MLIVGVALFLLRGYAFGGRIPNPAAACGYRRGPRWPSRLAWLVGTALAWGQIAAAHFGVGLAIGTIGLTIYVGATLLHRRAAQTMPWRQAALVGGLLPVTLFCVN